MNKGIDITSSFCPRSLLLYLLFGAIKIAKPFFKELQVHSFGKKSET